MSKELHCYQYVNRPFGAVRNALIGDALGLFDKGTKAAAHRAHVLATHLKVSVAGLEIAKSIVVKAKWVELHADAPGHIAPDAVAFELEWEAETSASLFPSMKAKLLAYALGPNETQLDLTGHYEPPGGVVGSAADWLLGHRVAEASVKQFLDDIASRLSTAAA